MPLRSAKVVSVHWCKSSRRKLPDRAEYPAPSPGHLIQDLRKRGGIGIRIGEERLKRPAVGIDSVERIRPKVPCVTSKPEVENSRRKAQTASLQEEKDVLLLHQALRRFSDLDPRKARVVEMRYFGGLSIEETAESLGVSAVTVTRDWQIARAWLARELGPATNASA